MVFEINYDFISLITFMFIQSNPQNSIVNSSIRTNQAIEILSHYYSCGCFIVFSSIFDPGVKEW